MYIYGYKGIGLEIAEILANRGETISAFVVDEKYLKNEPSRTIWGGTN